MTSTDRRGRARRRYSARTAAEARRMFDAGWTIAEIRDIVERTHGSRPEHETVHAWVDETYAQQRRNQFSRRRRMQRRERGVTWLPRSANADTKLHRMDVLREEASLSFKAIAAVMNLDYELALTPDQVRYYFNSGAVPKALRPVLSA